MRIRITTLPGDGIGPEVTAEAVRVLQAIAAIQGFKFEFEEHAIGGVAIKSFGSPLPRATLDAAYKNFTSLADRKKRIYDQDLISLLNNVVGAAA